jgi:hypothetical protein
MGEHSYRGTAPNLQLDLPGSRNKVRKWTKRKEKIAEIELVQ